MRTKLWAERFRSKFLEEINTLEAVLENRILPAFQNLEGEAKQVSEEKYKQLNTHSNEFSNGSQIAEDSYFAGVDYYSHLEDAKQGIINMFAASFYHLFEQQLFDILRYEFLEPEERDKHKLYTVCEIYDRLKEIGIDLQKCSSYNKISDELRQICNIVKHADGTSPNKFKTIKPEYFQNSFDRQHPEYILEGKKSVPRPLFGEGLYLTIEDLKIYTTAIKSFWEELAIIYDNK
jgi:hypothetical protein